ncbi:MAG: hypothetical protein K6U74_02735 [Firmicutes bacterium]|nr:hypothetical protein [Bacillota bacterium]
MLPKPIEQEILDVAGHHGPDIVLEAAGTLLQRKHGGELDRAICTVEKALLRLKLAKSTNSVEEIRAAAWELNSAVHKAVSAVNMMRYRYSENVQKR